MTLHTIDIPATLSANPWLAGAKVDGSGCPLFLKDMPVDDQQRLVLMTMKKAAVVLVREPARHRKFPGASRHEDRVPRLR